MKSTVDHDEFRIPADLPRRDLVEAYAAKVSAALGDELLGLSLTGSILTPDFNPRTSDINSVTVVRTLDSTVLAPLADLGAAFGKKGLRAPLIMSPDYIERSLDVFPMEFLDIKLCHATIHGADHFQGLAIEPRMLRLQCERELKRRLINLRQGYLSSCGKDKNLALLIGEAIPGTFPILKAILFLLGDDQPPLTRGEILNHTAEQLHIDLAPLKTMVDSPKIKPAEAPMLFDDLYRITDALSRTIDEFTL